MNVMTESLHRDNKALPQGLHVLPSYGTYNCRSQKTTVQLNNTKDHAIIIKKVTAMARLVAANEVPEMVVTDSAVGALQTQRLAKEGHTELTAEERRKILFKKLELSGLIPGQRRTKKELWTYWLNTMTSFHWKMEK